MDKIGEDKRKEVFERKKNEVVDLAN